ncbi:MAG: ABC transporter ATP-binding protein [Treponema sp.]|nr:ABC transporter ATP-binding protein [Treponema sp.]
MIAVKDFTKEYLEGIKKNRSFIIEDINLEIEDSSITALLGPNGSGKTTIIKALCGIHNPSKGKITFTDKDSQQYDTIKNPDLIMENIGYVPEISNLPPDIKVKDFLSYVSSIHNIENPQKEIQRVIEDCDLIQVLNKKIKSLSKGYKQRLSFAQAIIHNPKNLILDEPISGLDPIQIVEMRKLIKKLSKDKAILISTHILQEVISLSTKVYILNKGKLITWGSQEEIKNRLGAKDFESAFIQLISDKKGN